MKTFLLVAALAIPASAQQLTVQFPDNTPDCTYPLAWGNEAGAVSMCQGPDDIAVIVVSFTALPAPVSLPWPGYGSLRCDPSTIVLVEVMQPWQLPMGAIYWRWSIDLLPAWAPLQFVAQVVFANPLFLWTVPESFLFTWV